MVRNLIILDRDGVLNELVFRNGLPDSPMSIQEVKIFPWVVSCLERLRVFGFDLAIATNQPAAAKGKIEQSLLIEINEYIVSQLSNVQFSSVHICFHRAEDNCDCRKPKTKMLKEALSVRDFDSSQSWMVGDRATDIFAGSSVGINTALLGPSVGDDVYLLGNVRPIYYGSDLRDFTEFVTPE